MSFDHDSNLMHAKISWTCTASMCFNSQLIRKHIFAHSQRISYYLLCLLSTKITYDRWRKALQVHTIVIIVIISCVSAKKCGNCCKIEHFVNVTFIHHFLFIIFFFLSFIVVSFRLFVCFDFVVIIVDMVHRQARTVDGTICILCTLYNSHTHTHIVPNNLIYVKKWQNSMQNNWHNWLSRQKQWRDLAQHYTHENTVILHNNPHTVKSSKFKWNDRNGVFNEFVLAHSFCLCLARSILSLYIY